MYYGTICKLTNIRKHSNADRLLIGNAFGFQVIVGLDTNENQVGIFFSGDGQLSEEFCKNNDLLSYTDEHGNKKGGYFDHRRRVRTQKFHGEKSEGFWIPIESLAFTKAKLDDFKIGDKIEEVNKIPICNKYITKQTMSRGANNVKVHRGETVMFKKHYDTDQYRLCKNEFKKGDLIIITGKIHGTSQRTGYVKDSYYKKNWFHKLLGLKGKHISEWKYITGTRRVICEDLTTFVGWYGSEKFREDSAKLFDGKLNKGETVYYEVAGYVDYNIPIMNPHSLGKLKDKEMIKKYGETMTYTYGCNNGDHKVFVYRMTMTNEDGYTVNYTWEKTKQRCEEMGVETVKEIEEPFIFSGDIAVLDAFCEKWNDVPDVIDNRHILEGIVFRIENKKGVNVYKNKSYTFKVLEEIIKEDENAVDIEESA